jgi:hypothetical protein
MLPSPLGSGILHPNKSRRPLRSGNGCNTHRNCVIEENRPCLPEKHTPNPAGFSSRFPSAQEPDRREQIGAAVVSIRVVNY